MAFPNRTGIRAHAAIAVRILAVLLAAYLPISAFILAIKNDFFQAYFPVRHFMSEAIRNGEIPLWNPFLNYGFPIYGDMSGSYWNPGTWLLAFVGYNPYSFTAEQLIYLFMAGAGMYLLCGLWTRQRPIRFTAAVAFMCSGFMAGHLQHFNWISAAGILPFCLYGFIKYLDEGKTMQLAFAVFFNSLFLTSSHPGMIIGLLPFMGVLTVWLSSRNERPAQTLGRAGLVAILLAVVNAGLIYGYAEVLVHTNRAEMVPKEAMTGGSTGISSWISFLFPLAANAKGFLGNEITMRNCYIGLVLLAALTGMIRTKSSATQKMFFFTGIAYMVLASELVMPIYQYLPLLKYVRLNGEFRVFGLLALILAAVMQLEKKWSANQDGYRQLIQTPILWLVILGMFLATLSLITNGSSVAVVMEQSNASLRDWIKSFVHAFSWREAVLLQGLIHLMVFALQKKFRSLNAMAVLASTDLILATLLSLPFTGAGRTSLSEINRMVAQAPPGTLLPYTSPEADIVKAYPTTEKFIGGWGFYSKQVALPENLYYPLSLRTSEDYFAKDHAALLRQPFTFLKHGHGSVKTLSNRFSSYQIDVTTNKPDTLVLKQNIFEGWNATINGKPGEIIIVHQSLLGIPLPSGKHEVAASFNRPWVKFQLFAHWLMMALLLTLMARHYLIRYILP